MKSISSRRELGSSVDNDINKCVSVAHDMSSSKLPAIDQKKLSLIENSIFNLHEKLRKE